MRYLARTVVGLGLLSAAITADAYGIAQLIEIGNCGTSRHGQIVGPPCPSGTGEMIVLMVLGSFVGIFGAGIYASRGDPDGGGGGGLGMGIAVGQLRFWAAAIFASGAAVFIGVTDLHEDEFRPGMEIFAAGAGSVVVVQVLAFLMFGRSERGGRIPGVPGTLSSGPKQPPPRGGIPLPPPPPTGADLAAGMMSFPASPPPVVAPPLPPPSAPSPLPVSPPVPEGGFAGLGTDSVATSGLPGMEQTYTSQSPELEHSDLYAQLDRLAEQHRNGQLTDEQYEKARTDVLDKL